MKDMEDLVFKMLVLAVVKKYGKDGLLTIPEKYLALPKGGRIGFIYSIDPKSNEAVLAMLEGDDVDITKDGKAIKKFFKDRGIGPFGDNPGTIVVE